MKDLLSAPSCRDAVPSVGCACKSARIHMKRQFEKVVKLVTTSLPSFVKFWYTIYGFTSLGWC